MLYAEYLPEYVGHMILKKINMILLPWGMLALKKYTVLKTVLSSTKQSTVSYGGKNSGGEERSALQIRSQG